MLKPGHLLGLATIGQRLAEAFIFRRMLEGVAMVLILTIVVGLLIGGLCLGALYGCYITLMQYGLAPQIAVFSVVGFGLLGVLLFVLLTVQALRRFFSVTRLLRNADHPVSSRISSIVDAFIDGLTTQPTPPDSENKPRKNV